MKNSTLGFIGSLFGFTSVLSGALASHWLKSKLSFNQLESFKIAVYFLFFHALLFIIFAFVESEYFKKSLRFIIAGISVFSGSIFIMSLKYALGFTLPSWFHFITPIGGLILLVGWFLFMFSWRKEKEVLV